MLILKILAFIVLLMIALKLVFMVGVIFKILFFILVIGMIVWLWQAVFKKDPES